MSGKRRSNLLFGAPINCQSGPRRLRPARIRSSLGGAKATPYLPMDWLGGRAASQSWGYCQLIENCAERICPGKRPNGGKRVVRLLLHGSLSCNVTMGDCKDLPGAKSYLYAIG